MRSPWPVWNVSGPYIEELADTPETDDQMEFSAALKRNDVVGDRILELVPQHLHEAFLSTPGQRIVSILLLFLPTPTLIKNSRLRRR